MEGEILRDDQWERLKPFVPGGRKGRRIATRYDKIAANFPDFVKLASIMFRLK